MKHSLLIDATKAAGTPVFVYDNSHIKRRIRDLRAALPKETALYYSLKANPNLHISAQMTEHGLGLEVCSPVELETALRTGIDPARIIYVGPAKTAENCAQCIARGVGLVVVESLEELQMLEAATRSARQVQGVVLRINPTAPGHGKLVMSGRATQFGIDESLLRSAVAQCAKCTSLSLRGSHVYLGTRNLDINALTANTELAIATFEKLQAMAGSHLEFADLGGGFGVPYFDGEQPLDLTQLGIALAGPLNKAQARHPATTFAFELGRYLVAESGYCCIRVVHIKRSHGRVFAVCDGGTNVFATATASITRRKFRINALTPNIKGKQEIYTITGPLCTPTDALVSGVELPELQVGDILAMPNAGAYGPSASHTRFLSFGHPAEVLVEDATISLIRARETVDDMLAPQLHKTELLVPHHRTTVQSQTNPLRSVMTC